MRYPQTTRHEGRGTSNVSNTIFFFGLDSGSLSWDLGVTLLIIVRGWRGNHEVAGGSRPVICATDGGGKNLSEMS
jgi:hypothetical protein